MAFRIKDLLINVVPEGRRICPGGSVVPTPTRPHWTPTQSTFDCLPCPGCSGVTTHTIPTLTITFCPLLTGWPVTDPVVTAEQLAILKAELQKELALVEQQEKLVEESLRPKDLAEIEVLEAKLHEALKELERLKSELKKK